MSVRQTNGEPFKVSSLKAIPAAIDRYLKQAPINKPGSIVGDYEFKKANDTLNAVCKNLMKEGKVRPVVHKTPITSEQFQKLFESGQLGNANTKDPKQLANRVVLHIPVFREERKRKPTQSHSKDVYLRATPQGRRYFELRRDFPGTVLSTKNRRQLNDNNDEADGKMFVNFSRI